MTTVIQYIDHLCQNPCISAVEDRCSVESWLEILPSKNQWNVDKLGNIYALKKGLDRSKTLLIEAHRDVIGFVVKEHIERSFYSLSACGGINASLLPSTKLIVHTENGKRIPAVAASKPPHVLSAEERNKKLSIEDVYCDTGLCFSEIQPGNVVTFDSRLKHLSEDRISCAGLDNLVGVVSLLRAFEQIETPQYDTLFLLSVSEETSSRGVCSLLTDQKVDAAIVVDAGFHFMTGTDATKCIAMGKGPSVSVTDTLCTNMVQWVSSVAESSNLPLQFVCEPGGTGTSATSIQLMNGGIPSAVLSVPISNMHSPAEIAKISDVEETAKLLAALCNSKNIPFQEELSHELY